MCDSGSQRSLIAADIIRTANIKTTSEALDVITINGAVTKITEKVTVKLLPWFESNDSVETELLLLKDGWRQTYLPYSLTNWERPTGMQYADPKFQDPLPSPLLLGAEVWAKMINTGTLGNYHGAVMQSTIFGYIVFGRMNCRGAHQIISAGTKSSSTQNKTEIDAQLDQLLEKFWEMEELPEAPRRSAIEELVEQNFVQNYYRDPDGRYVVPLPLDPKQSTLGDSREIALRRFLMMEQKLSRNPDLRMQYIAFMREYEALGHMKVATKAPKPGELVYYIPHHCVSINVKFRVVFDGSCVTNLGVSLNDILLIGEKQQKDLSDILLRLRRHKVGIAADVKQMYRQIRVDPKYWNLQRIFWRENPKDELKEYWLTVITYGLASSPHTAVRTMIQCADDNAKHYPLAAKTIRESFYMDDCLAGAKDEMSALQLCQDMKTILAAGGFPLCKWQSNCPNIGQTMNGEHATEISLLPTETTVLGLRWLLPTDELSFKVRNIDPEKLKTKRELLRCTAQLYDPNGLISPVVVVAKNIIQELWKLKVGWDAPLPLEIIQRFQNFQGELKHLEQFKVPRWIRTDHAVECQLLGFSDASEKAFGAVVYVRTVDEQGKVQVRLLTSKSRVAPTKTISIARLELCAAELLARLITRVKAECEFTTAKCFMWTDSMIVLHWLRKSPSELKTFVANRVAAIQRKTEISMWSHVRTNQNPADLISRGVSASLLGRTDLWLIGPEWASQSESKWPTELCCPLNTKTQIDVWVECKPVPKVVTVNSVHHLSRQLTTQVVINGEAKQVKLPDQFSSLTKVLMVTSFVQRFVRNCRVKIQQQPFQKLRQAPVPNERELESALVFWIKQMQSESYAAELRQLKTNKLEELARGPLGSLVPELDKDGILRVGGRLESATCEYEQKHPIIIDGKSRLGWLMMNEAHQTLKHGNVQLMSHYFRQNFWMPRMKDIIRQFVHQCVVCTRQSKRLGEQRMGNLPSVRTRPAKPFRNAGIDFAGPFFLRDRIKPGPPKVSKCWVAVFVCMVTKAVHLDIVTDQKPESFIACFRRFTARRGECKEMYSDNSTTFVRANKDLQEAISTWDCPMVRKQINPTQWNFIPPAAPHQGGLWEAAVKSTKFHLKRVFGTHPYTYEHFNTALTEIEACLNSRPISALSDDPNDLRPLTPGHFLVGEPLLQPLPRNVIDIPDERLRLWEQMQKLVLSFWNRWKEEYLNTLQQRGKWRAAKENFREGQLVLIKKESVPPTFWLMGRILKVHTGADGLVRSVILKTQDGELERAVQKLVLLPIETAPVKLPMQCSVPEH